VIAVSAPIAAPAIGTGFGETSSVAYTGADVDSLIAVALAIIVLGLLLARRSKQVSARDAGNIRN
jgi:ACR3 family arsenite efflux pump ArsB